jgi:hypothetical protein
VASRDAALLPRFGLRASRKVLFLVAAIVVRLLLVLVRLSLEHGDLEFSRLLVAAAAPGPGECGTRAAAT